MKIILSRKGIDSGNSTVPSPILPDGTMLSIPIPSHDSLTYSDLSYEGLSYSDILQQLNFEEKNGNSPGCHLDPDIRPGVWTEAPTDWQPAFGQMKKAGGHLRKQEIGTGDLFLFFGLFRHTKWSEDNILLFEGPKIHAIYGYLQVKERLTGDDIFPWHPHARPDAIRDSNNVVFTAIDHLSINGKDMGRPGYGVFQFHPKLRLTRLNANEVTEWTLLPWMDGNMKMTHFTQRNIKKGYLQRHGSGQEFVITPNPTIFDWLKTLFED